MTDREKMMLCQGVVLAGIVLKHTPNKSKTAHEIIESLQAAVFFSLFQGIGEKESKLRDECVEELGLALEAGVPGLRRLLV